MNFNIRNLNDPDIPVPHPTLEALQRLWATNHPFDHAGTESIFVDAVRQTTQYHYERSEFYRNWLDKNGFNPDSIQTIEDIRKIPFIHANFYKTHVVKTVEDKDIALHLTSSGTTGQKTQMFFDAWTIFCSDKSADVQFKYYDMISDEPTNYLIYLFEPAENVNVGILRTGQMMRRYAKENELVYALKYTGSGHEFDLFGSINALLRFEKEGLPVRFLGFPAFLYFTLERMKSMGYPPLKLNPNSVVMTTGGWKGFADKQLTAAEFRSYIQERLGLPGKCCHDSYGAVEHGVAYINCPNHHLHIPVYSRALIRDVRTLQVLPFDKPGFLNLISPLNTTVPVVSLLLGDMAVMHEGKTCGCGVETPWFEILGRAGTSKNKSCAIAASELLKKK